MGNRVNIGTDIVFKRLLCLNSISESGAELSTARKFNHLKLQLESNLNQSINSAIKSTLRYYIESLCNINEANVFDPLYLIQEFNKLNQSDNAKYVLTEFTNRIMPYIEDLSTIRESMSRYDITLEQHKAITESADKLINADRIINNHEKISKRFNINNEVSKVKSKGLHYVVENCCEMIDTYRITPYAKFNLCLEELNYLLNKSGVIYDRQHLVQYVTEYFLLRSDTLSSEDLKGYKLVLKENCFINEDDTKSVDYVINGLDDYDSSKNIIIKKEIQSYLLNPNKTLAGLISVISNSLDSTNNETILLSNINPLIWLVWDVYKNDLFNFSCTDIFDFIRYKFANGNFSKDFLTKIITNLGVIRNTLDYKDINGDNDYRMRIKMFEECLVGLIDQINEIRYFTSYPKQNINAIDYVNQESVEIPLNEFKIFKFHNLIRASLNLDKFLKYKSRKIYEKGATVTRKVIGNVKDVLFGESVEDFYSSIGEDCKSDICVAQYYFDEYRIDETHDLFNGICMEFNNKLICENMDSIRSYYIINPGIVEVHLKESSKISIDESEWKNIKENSNYNDLDIYIENFGEVYTMLEDLSNLSEETLNIDNRLANFFKNENLSVEHFEVATEALSFLGAKKSQIKVFGEQFINYRYNTALLESVITESEYTKESKNINNIVYNWDSMSNVPLHMQLEAFYILDNILESTNKNDKKKNPFKGININSMRLFLLGLKDKMKKMSTKEKEISRNLDNSFRIFVKSMKNALISDRREAIIKGSVIPSFSRCIKIAIGLAGLGLIFGNPVIPLMVAIGGFAMSKNLTKKERVLLLDEIETELQVVDKEISMAESNNQMKKYRVLLNYKKNLQRQYQRIRYNIRIGKDILPGSAAGMPNNSED